MGMGSPVNNAMQQAPQRIGGKGSNMPRQMNNAPMSPFEFQSGAQPGALHPMADTFVRPTSPAMDGSSIAPQPIGGKGGGVAGMPLGMAQPQMPPPGMPQQQIPPGYDQRFFDKQMQLRDQIQRFTDKRFGGMTPENMAQIQEAVQDRFGRKMDRLDQMRPQMPTQYPVRPQMPMFAQPQTQAPALGLAALSQDPTLRNLLG